jgi:hypothetical protein
MFVLMLAYMDVLCMHMCVYALVCVPCKQGKRVKAGQSVGESHTHTFNNLNFQCQIQYYAA